MLKNIVAEVDTKYKKFFSVGDSILIFKLCSPCDGKVSKYGYASNEDVDILFMN